MPAPIRKSSNLSFKNARDFLRALSARGAGYFETIARSMVNLVREDVTLNIDQRLAIQVAIEHLAKEHLDNRDDGHLTMNMLRVADYVNGLAPRSPA